MQYNLRSSDGEIHSVSLESSENGLKVVGASMRFEKSENGELVLIQDDNSDLIPVIKIRDYWWIHHNGRAVRLELIENISEEKNKLQGGLIAPMPGLIEEVMVMEGEEVSKGQTLLVLEAMKMEHRITAPHDGIVLSIHHNIGDRVVQGAILITLDKNDG